MRPLPLLIGLCAALPAGLLLLPGCGRATSDPPITVERGALPVPSPEPETASLPVSVREPEPVDTGTPNPPPTAAPARAPVLPPRPAPRDARWTVEPVTVPYLPPVVPPATAPVVANRTPPEPVAKRAEPESSPLPAPATASRPSVDLQDRCVECGEKAVRHVTRRGRMLAFCRRHFSPPSATAGERNFAATPPHDDPELVPAGPAPGGGAPTPSAPAATPPAPDPTPAPAQAEPRRCLGETRSGDRCRRKTLHPSGYCYQHQTPSSRR